VISFSINRPTTNSYVDLNFAFLIIVQQKVFVENMKGRNHLKDVGVNGRMMLRQILEN
jgi:hypothetical protein